MQDFHYCKSRWTGVHAWTQQCDSDLLKLLKHGVQVHTSVFICYSSKHKVKTVSSDVEQKYFGGTAAESVVRGMVSLLLKLR